MSYDLAFWVDDRTQRPAPIEVYRDLVGGRPVPGLADFDAVAVLTALGASGFGGLEPTPTGASGHAVHEGRDSTVFEFAWSPQHLVVTARGRYSNAQMNEIIDAAVDVGGARLYDPQVDERFDEG